MWKNFSTRARLVHSILTLFIKKNMRKTTNTTSTLTSPSRSQEEYLLQKKSKLATLRALKPNTRLRFARIGSWQDSVHSKTAAPSHMVTMSLTQSQTSLKTTRQSFVDASTKSYTALTDLGANSNTKVTMCPTKMTITITCPHNRQPNLSRILRFLLLKPERQLKTNLRS